MSKNVNECVIPPGRELEFLCTLNNLKKGELRTLCMGADKYCRRSDFPIIISSIASNPFIFDALFQFDKFVLPFSKRYYDELDDSVVNKILDYSSTKELLKKGIISFPRNQIFRETNEEILEKGLEYINNAVLNSKTFENNDPISTYSILSGYSEYEQWFKSNRFLKSDDDIFNLDWMFSLNIEQFSKKVFQEDWGSIRSPLGTCSFKFESETPLYFDIEATGLSLIVDKMVNQGTFNAFQYIINEFYDLKDELKEELVKKNLFQVELTYETPLGFSMILNELPSNSNPSEMFDKILELRKDSSLNEFKKLLWDLDKAISTKSIGEVSKFKNDVESVTNSLKEEFKSSTIVDNSTTTFPNYLGDIFDDVCALLSGNPGLKTIKNIISKIELSLISKKPLHLQHAHFIGEHIIKSKDLEDELKRCFSGKIDDDTLLELRQNLLIYSKASEIANRLST